ncbi:MAG: TonB-dependent receptor [Deltaproteobacteria bacterium]|nr:TonB-dependent receptor [Deltaproteobacteria bacterium]
MEAAALSPEQKALQLNLDDQKYGTLAEIGAGQEVAGWFFRAGRAAGTVAKSMSAYDMKISDAIYGRSGRYVCRERLLAMLQREYDLLLERLSPTRGDTTCFFAFADTVATCGATRERGEAWLGIRFQHMPGAEPSDILLHAHLLDSVRLHEQEALGILGVNLIYGAYFVRNDPRALVALLLDDLSPRRVEVDLIRFSGPAFPAVDNRLVSLQLVEQGLTDAVMFTAAGEVVQPSEVLYRKPVLVERGRFRPLTHLTLDILERAREQFVEDPALAGEEPVVLMEMTLADLGGERGPIVHADYLSRVDTLRTVGKTVLVSKFARYFRLVEYLARYTQNKIGIALGIPTVRQIDDEKFYEDLPGGALEASGRLFRRNVRLYVYPALDPTTGAIVTAENLELPEESRPLHAFLLQRRSFAAIRRYNPAFLRISADDVLARLRKGDPSWEASVPTGVAEAIKREGLFGWVGPRTVA